MRYAAQNASVKANMVDMTCHTCGNVFYDWPSTNKKSKIRFCSRECYYIYHAGPKTEYTCHHCGKKFIRRISDVKSTITYCDRQCQDNAQRYKIDDPKFAEIFWSYVNKTDDCWLWTGHSDDDGYGTIVLGKKDQRAHRVAYELVYGPFDSSLLVLHSCDNPPCVRPNHLFLGTNLDNIRDMVRKGRQSRTGPLNPCKGEQSPHSKLTEQSVREIRSLHTNHILTPDQLAIKYHITRSNIYAVIHGRIWKHVA